ncbi:MAG: glycoside hydrolase family 31 protein [Verrucomicrobiota bacterium]|nr:glycoside hydrolase family 31 protein [Verrucomicrobiota bacterium]
MNPIHPGIWKVTLGTPEKLTPISMRNRQPVPVERFTQLSETTHPPFESSQIKSYQTQRGFVIEIPLGFEDSVYGLGLQLKSFNQIAKKKTLRVNSDPIADAGDSHAPVPFYVTTSGYGILVDTARYATFYVACATPLQKREAHDKGQKTNLGAFTQDLYVDKSVAQNKRIFIEIPHVQGADIYIFGGPNMKDAVSRYNLFSGGGVLPPRWGLGVWYRGRADFGTDDFLKLADNFRSSNMPCDVLGFEPGWQTHSYACSYVWNTEKFPNPKAVVDALAEKGFKVNLWSHQFTHPASPIYQQVQDFSGNFEAFKQGVVPDLTLPNVRKIFADHHDKEHVSLGVSGYKLDECDNSDFIAFPWSFPEISQFPGGLDGEQMHSLMGVNYMETIDSVFVKRNLRTYSEVRNAHALSSSYPFVLYSDLYDHNDFIRGVVNSGFSGLLWCPEVREGASEEDLIRRIQSVCLSPQALVNAWYIKNPPWKQWRYTENNEDKFLENYEQLEASCRKFFELRMQLIPYLYGAFYQYYLKGTPPFRALVMDYPHDKETYGVDNQWMMGDNLMVAPIVAGKAEREIYLPEGEWFDFWTGQKYPGSQKSTMKVPLDIIPLFVKSGTVLPLAKPTPHTGDPNSFKLDIFIYGQGNLPATLIEDDGNTYDFTRGVCNLASVSSSSGQAHLVRTGQFNGQQYTIESTKHIQ